MLAAYDGVKEAGCQWLSEFFIQNILVIMELVCCVISLDNSDKPYNINI